VKAHKLQTVLTRQWSFYVRRIVKKRIHGIRKIWQNDDSYLEKIWAPKLFSEASRFTTRNAVLTGPNWLILDFKVTFIQVWVRPYQVVFVAANSRHLQVQKHAGNTVDSNKTSLRLGSDVTATILTTHADAHASSVAVLISGISGTHFRAPWPCTGSGTASRRCCSCCCGSRCGRKTPLSHGVANTSRSCCRVASPSKPDVARSPSAPWARRRTSGWSSSNKPPVDVCTSWSRCCCPIPRGSVGCGERVGLQVRL